MKMTRKTIDIDIYKNLKIISTTDEIIHLYLLIREFYKAINPDGLITDILKKTPSTTELMIMDDFFSNIDRLNSTSPAYKIYFYREVVKLEKSLLDNFLIKTFVEVVSHVNETMYRFYTEEITSEVAKNILESCLSKLEGNKDSNILDSLYDRIHSIISTF